ncbi:hypothetical protein BXY66_3837 [Shimia isoporae]|uniref:Uncharacterized protein n=1 Tax=Shimia isoporae TaxID=647720 RepID=A0A4R1N0M8_9RHOB|nr:hypothetical protein [Shimia isoporae]TCK99335.1 hypothetical protein BXY66_3837 [Shimia isoporae]
MSQPQLPDTIRLHDDEDLIAIWQPAFGPFLRKLVVVSLLTAVVLGRLIFVFTDLSGVLSWTISILVSAALYAFLFDDVFEWRQRRDDHWVLTNWRLIFVNPMDESEPDSLSLSDCGTAKGWMWWSVRLRLLPRGAMILPFLKDRKGVAAEINTAVSTYRSAQSAGGTS